MLPLACFVVVELLRCTIVQGSFTNYRLCKATLSSYSLQCCKNRMVLLSLTKELVCTLLQSWKVNQSTTGLFLVLKVMHSHPPITYKQYSQVAVPCSCLFVNQLQFCIRQNKCHSNDQCQAKEQCSRTGAHRGPHNQETRAHSQKAQS